METAVSSFFYLKLSSFLLKNVPNKKISLDNVISIDNNIFSRHLIFQGVVFPK
jgi:hypothetical protein